MPNINKTINTTSTPLELSGSIRAIQITNMTANPVTIKLSEDGAAVFGAGIVLPFQYATFSYQSEAAFLGVSSGIATGSASNVAIFYQ